VNAGVVLAPAGAGDLEGCLQAVLAQSGSAAVHVLCDAAADSPTRRRLDAVTSAAAGEGRTVHILTPDPPIGPVEAINRALRRVVEDGCDLVFLIEQNVALDAGWCEQIAEVMSTDPSIAIVGSRVLAPNRRTVTHAGGHLERPGMLLRHAGHHDRSFAGERHAPYEVEFVSLAAAGIRASALRSVGLLDESFARSGYEAAEWCLRASRQGLTVVHAPGAVVIQPPFRRLPSMLELTTSHRDRIHTALQDLADRQGRERFAAAERRLWSARRSVVEGHAIANAYLRAIGELPGWLARRTASTLSRREALEIADFLTDLRRESIRGAAVRDTVRPPVGGNRLR
jgi:hypothetical protein